MLDRLIDLVDRLGTWGYLVVFVVVVLECQALLGLFMPGESLVVAAGLLSSLGYLRPTTVIVVAALAAILGDSISYELGRWLGRPWLLKPRRWLRLRPEHVARVEGFFERHGAKSVVAGHFMHVLRALMPFVAGMSHMRYSRFLVFNAIGCVAWATVFVLLGYFVGESWHLIAGWIGGLSAAVVGLLLLAAAAGWWWRRRKRRRDAL